MKTTNPVHAVGLMSGTSLDGLDIILCSFHFKKNKGRYEIHDTCTIPYDSLWHNHLKNASNLKGFELINLHKHFGRFIGQQVYQFLQNKKYKPDFIASHGHTVFHEPEKGITFQLGDGACIAAETHITTISDFRSLDVALGGQGAPLVPIGDELLFHEFEYCLNLGGFANISYRPGKNRIAYDICPVNIAINYFAQQVNKDIDLNGELAKKGSINSSLLSELNNINYYKSSPPKSLGREWFEKQYLPICKEHQLNVYDTLRTVYEHITDQLVENVSKNGTVLVTGGGAKNTFLIKLFKQKSTAKIIIPDNEIVDFKEALIFAYLGYLRWNDKPNCLSSVTGASKDNIGGMIYKI